MYFSIRNQLFRLLKNSKGKLKFFGVLFCYVWTALDKWLIEGDNGMIKIFFSAIWDFLCNNFSFQHNQKKMQSFHLKPSLEGKRVEKSEFSELTKKFFSTDVFLFLT
ncbi:MAG: hypothetical protein LBP53_06385 [Candidatus Peribacteria bacterium]|jgi:hypothetical protein|nr:hypothetical protein [Candidatus Peribacteria bacterium]